MLVVAADVDVRGAGPGPADLGSRITVGETNVLSLKRGELEGRVLLDALRPAAAALECNLVHALVPRRPLEQVVQERARHKASAALTTVEHSMRLEDQQLLPDAAREMLDGHAVRASRSLVAASSRPSSDD